MNMSRRKRLDTDNYIQGILNNDRVILSKAITIAESTLAEDHKIATEILSAILPYTGKSIRIGITGIPGVGKSTFIEAFGNYITTLGLKVAVLSIDPSSQRSKGSILGDKTRMETLCNNPLAFIRPTASGNYLGGVHNKTRETMLLCEAAGYDIILIETVGVGQSETSVHGMVDFFLLLMLAGAGDELQGIKRGIMEMADGLVINKADGDNLQRCRLAQAQYKNALHLFPMPESEVLPEVLLCSAIEGTGIEQTWNMVDSYIHATRANGFFGKKRGLQQLQWLKECISWKLEQEFFGHPLVKHKLYTLETEISDNSKSIPQAIEELWTAYRQPYEL